MGERLWCNGKEIIKSFLYYCDEIGISLIQNINSLSLMFIAFLRSFCTCDYYKGVEWYFIKGRNVTVKKIIKPFFISLWGDRDFININAKFTCINGHTFFAIILYLFYNLNSMEIEPFYQTPMFSFKIQMKECKHSNFTFWNFKIFCKNWFFNHGIFRCWRIVTAILVLIRKNWCLKIEKSSS